MLVEVARPVTLISTILSLYALFHTAFLIPSGDLHQRIYAIFRNAGIGGGNLSSWRIGFSRVDFEVCPRRHAAHGNTSSSSVLLVGERHAYPLRRFLVRGKLLRVLPRYTLLTDRLEVRLYREIG